MEKTTVLCLLHVLYEVEGVGDCSQHSHIHVCAQILYIHACAVYFYTINRNARGKIILFKIIFIAFHMPTSIEMKDMDIIVADCASMNQLNKTRAV